MSAPVNTLGAMRADGFRADGSAGVHWVAYTEWGDPKAERTVICVHGLTRSGRDFDVLAAALAEDYRVICPDVAGRGGSDWLPEPGDYNNAVYAQDMLALIDHLGGGPVDWVGTSMGGLIGMTVAAGPGTPVRRMVINDIGPLIPQEALQRIAGYLAIPYAFDSMDGLEEHLRQVHAPFGPLSDDQWRHLAEHSGVTDADGVWRMHYDPAIFGPFRDIAGTDIEIWELWDAISCPCLVLRGADSDLLLAETAQEMTRRGPQTDLLTFDGMGHAPALMADDQIAAIRDWLARP